MYVVNTIQDYSNPKENRIHLVGERGLDEVSLSLEETLGIVNSPFTNENWVRFVYNVCKFSLRPYHNEEIGQIVKRKIMKKEWKVKNDEIRCLVFDTDLTAPTVCNWTRHFSYFTREDLLGGIGIYAMELEEDVSSNMALFRVGKIAQYHILSEQPFKSFMVAVTRKGKSKHWELVYGEIKNDKIPEIYIKSKRVRLNWFKVPSDFTNVLFHKKYAHDISYEEFEFGVRVAF